ncbi:MAG: type II secretion system F family protein [Patescibacteria group bacterium]
MFYDFKAKDAEGKDIQGVVEAPSEQAAQEALEERSLIPIMISVREMRSKLQTFKLFDHVRPKELVVFFRQLSTMSAATLPIVAALRILIKQTESQKLKTIISEIADEVDGGARLSQAFARHPEVFNNFYVNMVRSGETSGHLDEVLSYLADQREKDYDLMSKIRGAMIYPAFILSALCVVGVIMMVFVVPRLTSILTETGGELPVPTRILIGTSGFMAKFWWLLLILVVGAVVGLRFSLKQRPVRRWWDWMKIKLPIFGKLFQRIYIIRFTRSMNTLLKGGVPLPHALEITAEVVGSAVYRDLILRTVKQVQDGNPIAVEFVNSPEVPVMVSHMLSVGETTGQLEQILDRLTQFYAREVDNLVSNLVSLVEPLIMIVMGLAVGVMVAAIIMPMYNLASSL